MPVEVGAYQSEQFAMRLQTFEEFAQSALLPPPSASPTASSSSSSSLPSSANVPYLAQHRLFEQIPALRADISIPDYCYLDTGRASTSTSGGAARDGNDRFDTQDEAGIEDQDEASDDDDDDDGERAVQVHAWIGPAHTESCLHWDAPHNILAQVRGRKYVRLHAPAQSDRLDAHPPASKLFNTSRVNVGATGTGGAAAASAGASGGAGDADAGEAHAASSAYATLDYFECVLEPGDSLYIPPRWWHYVRALDASISVSFWF